MSHLCLSNPCPICYYTAAYWVLYQDGYFIEESTSWEDTFKFIKNLPEVKYD